jgi:hypothetical protein
MAQWEGKYSRGKTKGIFSPFFVEKVEIQQKGGDSIAFSR